MPGQPETVRPYLKIQTKMAVRQFRGKGGYLLQKPDAVSSIPGTNTKLNNTNSKVVLTATYMP